MSAWPKTSSDPGKFLLSLENIAQSIKTTSPFLKWNIFDNVTTLYWNYNDIR